MINSHSGYPAPGPENIPGRPTETSIWPTRDSDTDFSTDTLHVQPTYEPNTPSAAERAGRRRRTRRGLLTAGAAALTAAGTAAAVLLANAGNNESRNPGIAINNDTETSAPQTSGVEATEQSAPPEADVVTPLPEEGEGEGEGFTPPKRPEELVPTAETILATENASTTLVDMYNSELAASVLTYEGPNASFDEVFLGGAWSFPKKESALDGATTDEMKPTFKHTKDEGLAFRTEYSQLFDAVEECEEANGGRDCAYELNFERSTGGAEYPQYYRLDSDDPGIPPQTVRVRTPLTEAGQNASITISGYDAKTGRWINSQTLQAPVADVRYKDSTGKYHTTWIPYPTNRD